MAAHARPASGDDYPYYRGAYVLDVGRVRALVAKLRPAITCAPVAPGGRRRGGRLQRLSLPGLPRRVAIIQAPWERDAELNSLADYFSERCRVTCRFLGHASPLEHWRRNRSRLVAAAAAGGRVVRGGEEVLRLREAMYASTRMCNNFRVTVAITVLRMLRARRWLDISAGWGDRLLAALLTDTVEAYCGVDPNPCLQPAYREMIEAFCAGEPRRRARYTVLQGGFESVDLPAGETYDLVFSSPPFFDLETYSDAAEDSLVRHGAAGVRAWFEGFLMPSLAKAVGRLQPGGRLVLYMGESRGTSYMAEMRRRLSEPELGMVPSGAIYYEDHGTLREFLVWRRRAGGARPLRKAMDPRA